MYPNLAEVGRYSPSPLDWSICLVDFHSMLRMLHIPAVNSRLLERNSSKDSGLKQSVCRGNELGKTLSNNFFYNQHCHNVCLSAKCKYFFWTNFHKKYNSCLNFPMWVWDNQSCARNWNSNLSLLSNRNFDIYLLYTEDYFENQDEFISKW